VEESQQLLNDLYNDATAEEYEVFLRVVTRLLTQVQNARRIVNNVRQGLILLEN